jgi:tRNA(Ile)-lysidine synthase
MKPVDKNINKIKTIEQKVISFIESRKLVARGDKIIIALSGGPDSVFALHFFYKYSKKYIVDLTAVHFNHNLRGKESDGDEKFCERLCEKLNIPFYSIQLDVKTFAKQNKLSIEEAARILRYKNLEEIRIDFDCDKIVTAHNINDNTETVLLNFFTGTGHSGFSGIPIKRGSIIRPFLCLAKNEITDYLDIQKIKYRVDASNLKNDYKRNFLRNKIIPLLKEKINPALDEAIFKSSKNLELALGVIEDFTSALYKKFVSEKENVIAINTSLFESNEEFEIGEVIKKILREKFNHDFEYDDLIKMKSLYKNQKGKSIQLSANLKAVREKDRIVFLNQKESENVEYKIKAGEVIKAAGFSIGIKQVGKEKIKFGGAGKSEFIAADKLDDIFILRRWKPGDSFTPLGMKSSKKVSDFLTDTKIDNISRKKYFVLENRNNIVWVVGLRIDDKVKINSSTKKIYKLWIK